LRNGLLVVRFQELQREQLRNLSLSLLGGFESSLLGRGTLLLLCPGKLLGALLLLCLLLEEIITLLAFLSLGSSLSVVCLAKLFILAVLLG